MAPRRRHTARNKTYAHIDGLEEFLRDTGVAAEHIKRAETIFAKVAAATVATRAKEIARTEGRLATRASEEVEVVGPGTVAYGGKGYSMGAEFGALQYKQFEMWRGNQDDAGYFFWPAIREFRDEDMINAWVHEVWKVIKPLFPESS